MRTKLVEMEAEGVEVYGKGTIGCDRANKPIMLVAYDNDGIIDIFLTTQQADSLAKRLREQIEENKTK